MVAVVHGADVGQRLGGVLAGQVHGHLPGEGDGPLARARAQVIDAHPELSADEVADGLAGDLRRGADQVEHHLPGHGQVGRDAVQAGLGLDADDGALHAADVALQVFGHEADQILVRGQAVQLELVADDARPGLIVGRLDTGDQAGGHAAAEVLVDAGDAADRQGRGEDHPPPGLDQVVEDGVELLLGLVLAGQGVHVLDEQHVAVVDVFLGELLHGVGADALDHVRGELLRGQVVQTGGGRRAEHLVDHGLGEVALAQPGGAVHEQAVAEGGVTGGQRLAGRAGEQVGLAHHELLEGEGRVERAQTRPAAGHPGQAELALAARFELHGFRLGHLQPDLLGQPLLPGLLTDEAQVAVLHPGTEEPVRTDKFEQSTILPPALQRLDPQPEFTVRQSFVQRCFERMPRHNEVPCTYG